MVKYLADERTVGKTSFKGETQNETSMGASVRRVTRRKKEGVINNEKNCMS